MFVVILMIAFFFCFVVFVSILFAGRIDFIIKNQKTIGENQEELERNQITILKHIDSLKIKE